MIRASGSKFSGRRRGAMVRLALVVALGCDRVSGLDGFELRDTPDARSDAPGGQVDASGAAGLGGGGAGGAGGSTVAGGTGGAGDGGGTGGQPDCTPPCPGGATCESGSCQCPASAPTVCADACVNVQTSLEHCGDCGAPCAGGCAAGRCREEYAGPNVFGGFFAVDESNIYVAGYESAVYALPLDGGAVMVLAEGSSISVKGLAVNATHVFWTDAKAKGVMRVAKTGGTPVVVASTATGVPWAVTANDVHVYWSDMGDDTIKRVAVDGGTPVAIAPASDALVIAINDTAVCWAEGNNGVGALACIPTAEGDAQTLATDQPYVIAIAMSGDTLFWTVDEGAIGAIRSIPLAGGDPTTVWSGPGTPRGVAVDDTHVYWSVDYEGLLMKAPLAGGPATTVATAGGNLYQVEVDATSLFYGTVGYVGRITPK